MLFVYRILINLILIFSPLVILVRLFKKKEDFTRFKEKFCFFSRKRKNGNLIWIHVASIGELMSIIPLIYEIENINKIKQILVTSTTVSSSYIFQKFKFKKTIHQFFPIDTNYFSKKFLNYWRPKLVIFVESEIWPNILVNLKKRSINHILLNARITNKTFRRWKKVNSFSKKLFQSFNVVYPQNIETGKYLKQFGCEKIKNLGNLKFINSIEKIEDGLNNKIIRKRKIWCASSTHNNEEMISARTHLKLKKKLNNLLTIIIPRHIDRKDDIINSLSTLKLKIHLHSSKKQIADDIDIYLVDTYGETKKFFKVSKIVFLGGSMINHGGQNPLEAARFGCKILHGKYIHNFTEIYSLLKKNKQSEKINSQKHLDYVLKKSLMKNYMTDIFIKKLNKNADLILKKTTDEIISLI
jgi:3-deoxy-D-manno-octulosonic-acid transferase